MAKRFVAIWFPHLLTDWLVIRRPELQHLPFVVAAPDHGRLVITAASKTAQAQGIHAGAVVADARALIPDLQVFNNRPGLAAQLLSALCKWCIRFTPTAAADLPDGLLLDASGCAHLWGGEAPYLDDIAARLKAYGYHIRIAMAGTIGAAWAAARYGQPVSVIHSGHEARTLSALPPAALRLDPLILERLQKLGLSRISTFIEMPRAVLRRRFGPELLYRLDQALGREDEALQPLEPVQPWQERLPCLEPILTATGIGIALERLLTVLCSSLQQKGKGLRTAVLKAYRLDGKIEQVQAGTHRASHNVAHLLKLFEHKIAAIEPDLGIELFILEAPDVEDVAPQQETLWTTGCSLESIGLAQLADRLAGKAGAPAIRRYLPLPHYWPERSIQATASFTEKPVTGWPTDHPRPIQLLPRPEPVEVSAPIPDYPPMLFRYKGALHNIKKADGPERIEQEWWLEAGPHRDYYIVEDEAGRRYWLFRLGHYSGSEPPRWFIHGFFA
ncbi:MAG TPA: DNA polymerase Y family protein [Chitinophaga sp.]|uniref:Y-family DNA polymerase n=1 Tax=Chitinophaga sp. TaxID=1869181 RepID=UPI002DB57FB0|nr:DNA polymerase Y family protein [Chitinophaga sp.]HEU4554024.1 DNA polymerase Y family protein [Chitinophaga sp.]